MAVLFGTEGNDSRTVVNPGTFTFDGLGGTDTFFFGTSLRSSYTIVRADDGAVQIDSVSGASSGLHATLYNVELLVFASGSDTINLATFFGDTTAPTVTFSDNVPGTASGNISYTLTFSEPVVGLAGSDFVVSNGSVLSVTGTGQVYTVLVAPTPQTVGNLALSLVAVAVTDMAGNVNLLAMAPLQAIDTRAPTVTTLVGGSNHDVFSPGAGQFVVNGMGGIDSVVLPQARSAYTVAPSANGFSVASNVPGTSLALTQVERLRFSDTQLALDLDAHTGHAAQTVKILGAVFGPTSIAAHPDYVGIGLNLLDGGMAYEPLIQLALDARLGANATPAQVVDLLYTNVVGVAPSPEEQAYFVGLLTSHTYTPASLGVLAADHELNLLHIDLVGLARTGVEYSGG